MTPASRRRSIATTLTLMNALVSGIALILVYVSFLAYNLLSFREAAVRNLSAEAKIIGSNSVSAILFDDRASANTTLSALANSSDVVAAAVYTDSVVPFAQYPANGVTVPERRPLPANRDAAHWTSGTEILIGSRIVFHGKVVGAVYVQARLRDLREQALRYAAIAAGILAFCLVVALMVGGIFRRILAKPIVAFAQTARLVSRYRDYSLRFDSEQGYGELTSLTEAFNEMLAEIQQRDSALEQAKADLERRVEERTAQLQAANRELEAFSYTVAHDLRGPLQTIINVCYLLGQAEPGETLADNSPMLLQLRSSVTAMSQMIDDLLNLSRSTSAPLHLTETDLSVMAAAILRNLAETDPERRVETWVHPNCNANTDPGLMEIVLENLLRNAWKFTGRRNPARIEFGCLRADKDVVFFVRDNGAGFDQRLVDRLFKPFQRLHAASDFPGTGIGLATVHRIVERHSGAVWAEGEIDKGATLYFTLHGPRPAGVQVPRT
ncbi:MAG: ATP-binding protein [Terracidiphilus sp.]